MMFIIVWVLLIRLIMKTGSWTVNPDETRYNPGCKGAECDVSSFTLPFPTEDVVFNPNLMKDPVHVDVRSEFSY